MKRLFVVLGILAGLMIPVAALASPGLKLDKQAIAGKQCTVDGATKLVDVHFALVNDYDSGFAGNAWANDTIDRHLRVWSLDDGTFCAQVADHGTFVTFAGPSPSGTATVSAGVEGKLDGGYVSTLFTGTLDPTPLYASHGDLGTYDLQCTDASNCPGAHPSPLSYFSSTVGFDLAQWGWIYHAGKHGTWLNQDDVAAADGGDITG
jgi:hypothetical protein